MACKNEHSDSVRAQQLILEQTVARLKHFQKEVKAEQAHVESEVYEAANDLHDIIDSRNAKLAKDLQEITQKKLSSLLAQKEWMEANCTQLRRFLASVQEKLEDKEEILKMKGTLITKMSKTCNEFQPESLVPNTTADAVFSAPLEVMEMCRSFGTVLSPKVPVVEKCYAVGKTLETAMVGREAKMMLNVVNFIGEPCDERPELIECNLVSKLTGVSVPGAVERIEKGLYSLTYKPVCKGKHKLDIKIDKKHIRGSPWFALTVSLPVTELGTRMLTTSGLEGPSGIAIMQSGDLVLTESDGSCISFYSPSGQKRASFGQYGSKRGEFNLPSGIAVDSGGDIFVADCYNHRVQKFSRRGSLLAAAGAKEIGDGHVQFSFPKDVAYNSISKKLYVVDWSHQVKVLNSDNLSFHSSFGTKGRNKGQFNNPSGITCDSSRGDVYVADSSNHRIQVFTSKGEFLRCFSNCNKSTGKLRHPLGIAVDRNGVVYVAEYQNNRISLFSSQGEFITSFVSKFQHPHGVAVDCDGVVYVCDLCNNKVKAF